jgi:hypothetical protein
MLAHSTHNHRNVDMSHPGCRDHPMVILQAHAAPLKSAIWLCLSSFALCVSFRTGLKPGQSMAIAKKMQFSCDKATQEVSATR